MSIDIAVEFDLLKKEIRAYQSELSQSIASLQTDVKELKNTVASNAGAQHSENTSVANQHTLSSSAFPFQQLAKAGAFEDTGIAQLLHPTNDNTSDSTQPPEKYVPKGMGLIRKDFDLCLLFTATGCSVANSLTAELMSITENNIKLTNFLCPHLVSQDVALYIENSIAKASVIGLILSKGTLKEPGLVFAVECALLYSSPIVLIHDQSQDLFPGEDDQPVSLKDAGIFNDKAITFSSSYAEACAREALKKLEKVAAKTDLGVFITNTNLVQQSLQKVQHSFLPLPSSGIPLEEVLHSISHLRALVTFFSSDLLENKSYLTSILEAAVIAGVRIYIVYDPNDPVVVPYARTEYPKLGIASKVFESTGMLEAALKQVIAAEKAAGGCQRKVEDVRTRGFLSHKRSSAQGIAGRIFQALRNDYKIFLDSEADFELHDLQEIVKQTELFIFILSEGIFDSFWCLQELKSAIAYRKKVVLLRDVKYVLPKKFSNDQQDIAEIIKNTPMIDYIPEFFNDCILQLRKYLGPSEKEIQAMLASSEFKKMETQPDADTFTFSEIPESTTLASFLETGLYSSKFVDFVKKLQTVEIQNFPFDTHLAEMLLIYFSDLKHLRLTKQEQVDDGAITRITCRLESLRITNSPISPSVFAGIKPENSPIKKISIENCPNITGDIFELLLSKFPELQHIEVMGSSIQDKQVILNQQWPNIKTLNIQASAQLGKEGLHTLLKAFPNLEQLNASMCPLKEDSIKDIRSRSPMLTELSMIFCNISIAVLQELDAQGIHAVASDTSQEGLIKGPKEYSSYIPYPSYEESGCFSFHTEEENGPWWKMTLPHDAAITRLVLRNRTDGCQDRICPAELYIMNEHEQVIKTLEITKVKAVYSWEGINTIGRVIKVQLLKRNPLHFAELQVYQMPLVDLHTELLYTGSGKVQTSSYIKYADHERRGCFSFHTHEEENPWWKKTLDFPVFVTKLVLNNRTDGCKERIDGAILEILDENDQVVKNLPVDGVDNSYTFPDLNVTGKAFRVRLERRGILHFTTLDIYHKLAKKPK